MPVLSDWNPSNVIKMLYLGDSGAGKTGSLLSLAAAGYNLRIIDLDVGAEIIKRTLSDPKSPYPKEAASRIHIVNFTDKMRNLNGVIQPGQATAWPAMVKMLSHWKEAETPTSPAIDLGPITSWGENDILVIDSLSRAADWAVNYHLFLNGRLNAAREGFQWMRDIGTAQSQYIENFLKLLYDTTIKCHVIVVGHVLYVEDKNSILAEGKRPEKGYAQSIGKANAAKLGQYFNHCLLAQPDGIGASRKYLIHTRPPGMVELKTPAFASAPAQLPLATGLATYFELVRGTKPTLT